MGDDSNQTDFESVVSRRRVLSVAGTVGAMALAGCSGDNNGSTADGGGSGSSGVSSMSFVNAIANNPVDHHFNSAASQNFSWAAHRPLFAPFMKYSFTDDEFLLGALSDVQIDGTEVVLTFRDDLKWEDGSDWTTDDFEVQLELAKKVENSLWGYLDGYEIDDEKTATLTLSGPTSPKIIKFELTNFFADTKVSTHEQWLDKSAEEYLQWAWEDPVATGFMKFVTKDQQAFEYERNPEFYNADNINFETYLLKYFEGNTPQHQALAAGEQVDAASSLFTPPNTAEQFPDHVVEVNIPAKWGYGIVFNHNDPDFGTRAVRQAIAHVINREELVKNAGPRTKFVTGTPCGIAPRDQEYWLGDWLGDFETYGADGSQTDEATTLLENAGYTKSGGTWQNSDGEALGGNYYTPAGWTDWTALTNTVVDQLNQFGFDFQISSKPTQDWTGQFSNSNFKMGALYWLPGGSRSSFPYFPLYYQLWATDIGGGHNYREIAESEQTIPSRDGSDMTITPIEVTEKIAQQSSDDDARPFVQQAAWHNHIDLPFLGLVSKFEQSWVTNDEWTNAEEDTTNRRVKWPPFWWPQQGELQYSG